MEEKKIVVTDQPRLTGYLHGTDFSEMRKTSDPTQQKKYEEGWRLGVTDSYKAGKRK